MTTSIIIAGFGGQGVLSMGKLICTAADAQHMKVTFFPSYGGEQRGGTCNCTVVISDEEIGTPVVSRADYLIIMNKPSYDRFRNSILPDGKRIINATQVQVQDIERSILVPMDEIAEECGSRMAANMVALGVFIRESRLLDASLVEDIIRQVMGSKPQYLEMNIRAFWAGVAR